MIVKTALWGGKQEAYEGECDDCGCLFDYDFRVPIWKCMLPRWIKNIIAKSALRRFEDV